MKHAFFDPREVPVIKVDTHLAPVPVDVLDVAALRGRFQKPPAWTPELRAERKFSQREPTHASVLIPIVLRSTPTVLLTLRTAHLSSHSGQIAFPGGKADTQDADVVATALREAQEEIGLRQEQVEILGALPHYTTGSAFVVTPVVALVQSQIQLVPNPDEVADVFEVPLAYLMNPAHHRHHSLDWEGERREWLSMPYLDQGREWFIWGATAGMLRNLYRFLQA